MIPSYQTHHPSSTNLLVISGFVVTLLFHGSILGLVVLATMQKQASIEAQIEPKMLVFEDVEMVALGETKPAHQLPQIANPTPAPVPKKAVVLNPKKNPKTKEKPTKKDHQKIDDVQKKPETEIKPDQARQQKMLDALSALHDEQRPANDIIPEGIKDGSATGSLSEAAKNNLLGAYQLKLLEALTKYWVVPSTLKPEDISKLAGSVAIYVRLSEQGYVVSYRFEKRSAQVQFDESIERVIKKFELRGGGKRLPLPEEKEVRDLVIKQGLNLKTWEYTGR